MAKFFVIVALFGLAAGASLNQDAEKNRPVTKVINMLKDMSSQLDKEGEEDEEVYDKMVCWCETNDKEKTKAIADAEQHITDLSASIEEMTGLSARLSQEITTLEGEVAKNTEALGKATGLRTKQLAEFNAEEKESLQGIASLKSAVTVLGKHNSFLQSAAGSDELTEVGLKLRSVLRNSKVELTRSQKNAILAFAQAPDAAFLQQAPSAGSYAPQGGQIFGILKNMKESFEANVAASQKEESDNVNAYQELKAAKENELEAGNTQINTKTLERADADEKKATDTQDLEDTTASLAADRDFLAMLKETCANMDAQMEERAKTRTLEKEAISKALAILSSDDAHDLMTGTFNAAFIQKSATSNRREHAAQVLATAGKLSHNPKLTLLATSVRLDAFKKVKEAIDKMIADLVVEKEDEIKFKDYCIDEMNKNEADTEVKNKEKADTQALIDELTNTVETLTTELDNLRANIAEMQKQMKRAGDDREIENVEFNKVVQDQRATMALLNGALNSLKGFYGIQMQKNTVAAKKQPAGPPPPPGFKSYENNKNSGGVMGMIQNIINDAKAMEAEAIRAESDAQKAYEDMVKDTNTAIDAANVEITNKSEAKAKAEGEKAEADTSLAATQATLDTLFNRNTALHSECDFVVKNFDLRQSSRDDEIEALKQSSSILSGAKVF